MEGRRLIIWRVEMTAYWIQYLESRDDNAKLTRKNVIELSFDKAESVAHRDGCGDTPSTKNGGYILGRSN